MHCTAAYNSMEAAVYNMYDRNNATIQDKLHELFEVLERTGKTIFAKRLFTKPCSQLAPVFDTIIQNLDPGKVTFTLVYQARPSLTLQKSERVRDGLVCFYPWCLCSCYYS